ncbi:MAG: SAM-dependent DNA methyltransferase [Nannocystaceae bacterium]
MKTRAKAAYGDFQTPPALAQEVLQRIVQWLASRGDAPATVIEPTCGIGAFLLAAAKALPRARLHGLEIDPARAGRARAARREAGHEAEIRVGDAFDEPWGEQLAGWPDPVLVLGNPPWVTSAELTVLGVDNLPAKSNFKALPGLAALTGKSNFDVSEWMLLRWLELGQGRPLTVAMLVKTAVARRVLEHAHRQGLALHDATLHRIDARASFGAAVDAGLLCFGTARDQPIRCPVYASLDAPGPEAEIGIRDGRLVADAEAYERARPALGTADPPWRSGIKHDCARVMELRREGEGLVNGLGEPASVEASVVYPLLKSSDLRGDDLPEARRWLLLPQRRLGEDTARLAVQAPAAWRYLLAHAQALDARRSSIYRGQPRFCVFGLGEYSFAPWKIAISGLSKRAAFTLVGPDAAGRPTLLDDTCYFIGFDDQARARTALSRLRSEPVAALLQALVFRDAKRPVTKEVLDRIQLDRIDLGDG